MTTFHLSKDGVARKCYAVGTCPLGDLPHDNFTDSEQAREWAESLVVKKYGSLAALEDKALKRSLVLAAYDDARRASNEAYDALQENWCAGRSAISLEMIGRVREHAQLQAEEEELSHAGATLTRVLSKARRGRELDGSPYSLSRSKSGYTKADKLTKALVLRQDIERLDELNRKYAAQRLRALVRPSSFVNSDLDDTPADRHPDVLNTIGKASHEDYLSSLGEEQDVRDAYGIKTDMKTTPYEAIPYRYKQSYFIAARSALNSALGGLGREEAFQHMLSEAKRVGVVHHETSLRLLTPDERKSMGDCLDRALVAAEAIRAGQAKSTPKLRLSLGSLKRLLGRP